MIIISGGTILSFIAINILAIAIVDTLPHGYARPAYVRQEVKKPYNGPGIPDSRTDIESGVPEGRAYEQDIGSERGFPDESREIYDTKKVITTRKPYVPPPVIEPPYDKGYGGIGRNGGNGKVSYARPSYN